MQWAVPEEAARTYALLYDTIDLLDTQMDATLWSLVYNERDARDRRQPWTRLLSYRHMRRNERGAYAVDRFERPERLDVPETGRSFETQTRDTFLCGLHAYNNVANSVLMTPPDILRTIELSGPLGSAYASLEDMQLAALRLGTFLMPVRVAERTDLVPLDRRQAFPEQKCALGLLMAAGGMMLYLPNPGGQLGHFVSLTYNKRRRSTDWRWSIHSMDRLETRGRTAAATLDNYIVSRVAVGLRPKRARRERKRRAQFMTQVAGDNYVGLLPLSLSLVDVIGDAERRLSVDDRVLQVLQRSLLRRSLSELRARVEPSEPGERTRYELTAPMPVAPNAIDELCFVISNGMEIDTAANRVTRSVFSGVDATNPASFVLRRHSIDSAINQKMEEFGSGLLLEFDANWTAESLQLRTEDDGRYALATTANNNNNNGGDDDDTMTDDDDDESSARLITATLGDRYGRLLLTLRQVRSEILDVPTIGLLFAPDERFEPFDKFSLLLSNRRWLRYIALLLAAGALIGELERVTTAQPAQVLPEPVRRLAALFFTSAFLSMQYLGVSIDPAHPMYRLFLRLTLADRARYLPLDDAPDYFQPFLRRAPNTPDGKLVSIYLDGGYEWYQWLINATAAALPDNTPPLPLDALRLRVRPVDSASDPANIPLDQQPGVVFDDNSVDYDRLAEFVSALRRTLFQLPGSGREFVFVDAALSEQFATAPTRPLLAAHFHEAAQAFVARVRADGFYDASSQEPLLWISALAFDPRYALDRQTAANDLDSHRLDEPLLRIVERTAQAGFNLVHRVIFGALTTRDDGRPVLRYNAQRVPPPPPGGTWRDTGPSRTDTVATTSIVSLPRFRALALYDDDDLL
jgi:hypothetical protein